jgi:hypothetical protein
VASEAKEASSQKKEGRKMKKQLFILSVVAALATANVYAQETTRLKVDVPFSFQVGTSIMPAGQYDVSSNAATPALLTLRSSDSKSIASIVTIPAQTLHPRDKAMLVFNHYKGEYFLSEVWNAGTNSGAQLRKTRRELEIARGEGNIDKSVLYAKGR